MSRIQPNDLCLIVASPPGCETNIGAFVTAVERDEKCPDDWLFKDATRPLLMVNEETCRVDPERVTSSWDDPDPDGWYYTLRESHLVPVPKPGLQTQLPEVLDLRLPA
jgi:hypothetical protein